MPCIGEYQSADDLIRAFQAGCGLSKSTSSSYASLIRALSSILDRKGLGYEDVDEKVLAAVSTELKSKRAKGSVVQTGAAIRAFYRWLEQEGILGNAEARVGKKHKPGALTRRKTKSPKGEKAPRVRKRGHLGSIDDLLVERFRTESGVTGSTFISYRTGISAFSRYLEDFKIKFDEVDEEVMLDFQDWVVAEFSESTAHQYVRGVKAFYDWLESEGYGGDMAEVMTFRRSTRGPIRLPLSVCDAKRVQEAAGDSPLFASTVALYAGGRLSLCSLSLILRNAFRRAGIEGDPWSYSLRQTAIDLAVSSGASRAEIVQLARYKNERSFRELELGYRERAQDEPVQIKVEKMLTALGDGRTTCILEAGKLRAMIDGLDDNELVAISMGASGDVAVTRMEIRRDRAASASFLCVSRSSCVTASRK